MRSRVEVIRDLKIVWRRWADNGRYNTLYLPYGTGVAIIDAIREVQAQIDRRDV